MNFVVLTDHCVKLKESEKEKKNKEKKRKNYKYLDLTRELKKLWNMKVTFILIVIGVLGTVTKRLIQGLKDCVYARKESRRENVAAVCFVILSVKEACEGLTQISRSEGRTKIT